jgi:two-component system, chemotaxis family, sensor kinase CheA
MRPLDHAAALLIALRPGNLRGVPEVRDALEAILAADEPPGVHQRAREAMGCVDSLLLGEGDAGGLIVRIGSLLEEAMEAPESPTTPPGAMPAPAAGALGDDSSIAFEMDPELLRDFLVESWEYLAEAEAALLVLEGDPTDSEAVNTVFRAFHTIKGTSAFMALDEISGLAHTAETLFDRFRKSELRCTGAYADLALRAVDGMGQMLNAVDERISGRGSAIPTGIATLRDALEQASRAAPSEPSPRLGDVLVDSGLASREEVEEVAGTKGARLIGEALVDAGVVSPAEVESALRRQGQSESAESSVRVRTDRLDRLIDLVGELVVAHSTLAQDTGSVGAESQELMKRIRHSGKLVRELQDLSMALRMVPLRATFQKLSRVVRDAARKSGKQVELVTVGEDTEIDRGMVDALADPLLHMIRNSVDHGIEPADQRLAAGKPAIGTITLSAEYGGGEVVVEIRDDGKGIDRERIQAKALERGLIDPQKNLTEDAVLDLIFAPGLSTAQSVTDLSGRGVGMDVVRRNVESLRGRVSVASETGSGSVFTLRLPLTLAITDGMLVKVGSERYIVPTIAIRTSFRPRPEQLSTVSARGLLVMHNDEPFPVVALHRLFQVRDGHREATEATLLLVGSGRPVALMVDEILGQYQFVAKPLSTGLGRLPGISGSAILGDGRVGLILDIPELIESAHTREASSTAPAGELVQA